MVTELIIAGISFGVGVLQTLALVLVGYGLGRKSMGLDPEVELVLPRFRTERHYKTEEEKVDELSEDYFSKALLSPEEGGHEFPSDEELAYINRHSN